MNNQLLILGLDPGTTIGCAIIDINGNLINITSSKQLSLRSLILKIINYGEVIAVATDKNPAPKYVENFSAKVGAKLIKPSESLKVSKKKNLIKRFKTRNRHERDALASAIFAFKKLRPLFKKADNYLIKNKKTYLTNDLKKALLRGKLSISDTMKILETNHLL